MIREWLLSSMNQNRLRRRRYEVAVLPVGSCEAHNLHLPEGQDSLQTEAIAQESCRLAWKRPPTGRPSGRCPKVICLPTIPYGADSNLMDFPLTMHVRQSVLDEMVRDLVASCRRHGIRKVVLFNGHGGNDFLPMARLAQSDLDVHVFLCNVWEVGFDVYGGIFATPDDHAGEMETSVALALFPDEVELPYAGPGTPAPYRFEALRAGWVQTSRRFNRLNDQCAVGDPRAATAAKGRACLELVCGRISQFLVELAGSPIDGSFPQAPGTG
jgi:creatinine amidohydrolase